MAAVGGIRIEPVGGCEEVFSAEKRSERARDIIANPSRYSPCRASHFTGPPLVCSPQLAEKGGPTSLGRGEGLAA
jgi:hypothetical protein